MSRPSTFLSNCRFRHTFPATFQSSHWSSPRPAWYRGHRASSGARRVRTHDRLTPSRQCKPVRVPCCAGDRFAASRIPRPKCPGGLHSHSRAWSALTPWCPATARYCWRWLFSWKYSAQTFCFLSPVWNCLRLWFHAETFSSCFGGKAICLWAEFLPTPFGWWSRALPAVRQFGRSDCSRLDYY